MEYLSTLDAGFLEAEDADQHVSLAVGALAVLAGPTPEFASFKAGELSGLFSRPWIGGRRDYFVQIQTEKVTGRRLWADADDWQRVLSD